MHISKTDIAIGTAGLLAGAATAFAFSRTKLSPAFMAVGLAPPALAAAIVAVKATHSKGLPSADEIRRKEGETVPQALLRILNRLKGLQGITDAQFQATLKEIEEGDESKPFPDHLVGNPGMAYLSVAMAGSGGPITEKIYVEAEEQIRSGVHYYTALSECRIRLAIGPLQDAGIVPFDRADPTIFESDPKLCELALTWLESPTDITKRLYLYAHLHTKVEGEVWLQMWNCAYDCQPEVAGFSDEQMAAWITDRFPTLPKP